MEGKVLEAILTRRSVRQYKPEVLSEQQISAIVDAALASPSASNSQPWLLRVITRKPLIEEFDEAIFESFKDAAPEIYERSKSRGSTVLYHAPLVILVLIPEASKPLMDAGILAENIAIAAKGIGLDSVILGLPGFLFRSAEAGAKWREKLQIPKGYELGITVAVGYKADSAVVRDYAPDYSKVAYIR
ncbi:MAG: nitroreductase family protein [Clostridiales bacterium]|jgi:nitroreductase|nr:nitroreductase family protein [Clostridiales bacterium]